MYPTDDDLAMLRMYGMMAPNSSDNEYDSSDVMPGLSDGIPNIPVTTGLGGLISQQKPSILDQFKPQTAAQDRLNNLLDNFPTPQKPTLLHKIGAALVGAAYGPEEAMKYNNAPYAEQLAQWNAQTNVAQKEAQDEQQTNNIQRQLLVAQQTDSEKEAALAASTADKATLRGIEQQNANTRAASVAVANYKAQNPNSLIKIDANGNYIGINPRTQAASPILDESGNTINSGKQNDQLKEQINLENRLTEIAAQGANAVTTKQTEPGINTSRFVQYFQQPDGTIVGLDGEGNPHVINVPKGTNRVPTPGQNQGGTTTSTTTTSTPPGLLGRLVGIGPTVKSEKTTTTTKTPGNQAGGGNYTPATGYTQQNVEDMINKALTQGLYANRAQVLQALKLKGVIQ